MVQPKPAENNDRFFQKVFGDGEFIAAGQLVIPPKGRKPSKGTKDNTYVRVGFLCTHFPPPFFWLSRLDLLFFCGVGGVCIVKES
jgi:hypothetical protein